MTYKMQVRLKEDNTIRDVLRIDFEKEYCLVDMGWADVDESNRWDYPFDFKEVEFLPIQEVEFNPFKQLSNLFKINARLLCLESGQDWWSPFHVYHVVNDIITDDDGDGHTIANLDAFCLRFAGTEFRVLADDEFPTCQIKCTESNSFYWTKDKIYEMNDGKIIDDLGYDHFWQYPSELYSPFAVFEVVK